MSSEPSDLAERLRQAIRESGASLDQLAETAGVDAGRLSRFVRGDGDLSLEATAKLCQRLGLELRPTSPAATPGGPPPATPAPPPAKDLEAQAESPPPADVAREVEAPEPGQTKARGRTPKNR